MVKNQFNPDNLFGLIKVVVLGLMMCFMLIKTSSVFAASEWEEYARVCQSESITFPEISIGQAQDEEFMDNLTIDSEYELWVYDRKGGYLIKRWDKSVTIKDSLELRTDDAFFEQHINKMMQRGWQPLGGESLVSNTVPFISNVMSLLISGGCQTMVRK